MTKQLTQAERAVAARVAHGETNRQIARKLGKAEGTVRNQLSIIYSKLDIRNRVELAVEWSRLA